MTVARDRIERRIRTIGNEARRCASCFPLGRSLPAIRGVPASFR
jgi:hypothetical protein